MLEAILTEVRRASSGLTVELPQNFNLPCKTLDDIHALNSKLASDSDARSQLVAGLQCHYQLSVPGTVRKICGAIISTQLAHRINLSGSQNRIGLQSALPFIFNVIHGKCEQHFY